MLVFFSVMKMIEVKAVICSVCNTKITSLDVYEDGEQVDCYDFEKGGWCEEGRDHAILPDGVEFRCPECGEVLDNVLLDYGDGLEFLSVWDLLTTDVRIEELGEDD